MTLWIEKIKEVDKEGMLEQIMELSKQCKEAKKEAEKIKPIPFSPSNIVLCGMGGSGICADIAATVLYSQIDIPIVCVKSYSIPFFVNKNTLFIAISYSGMTAETINCVEEAEKKGALVYGVASGGILEKMCAERFIKVSSGLAPRCAVGSMTVATLSIISSICRLSGIKEQIDEASEIVQSLSERLCPQEENIAKEIACKILGKIPLVYGAEPLTKVAALRWKQQINENSKYICFYHAFPELLHNEITSFEALEHEVFLIILRDKEYHPLINKAMDFFIHHFNVPYIQIHSEGEGILARIFSLFYVGDFTSLYLAALRGKDPSAIHSIKLLKEALKK